MAIYYEEFDTTAGGLVAALQSKIVAHAAWDALTPTGVPSFTNTAQIAASSQSFAVSSVTGLFIGQRIKWTVSSVVYTRTITDIVVGTNTLTISTSIGVITPITTTIVADVNLVKATTTRGAEMILDLQAGRDDMDTLRLTTRWWRTMPASYSSANPQAEAVDRFVYWRSSGGSLAHNLHVTLSVGKEHLFIAIEGPRWNEAGALNAQYGSGKNYLFMSDLVPYHAADTSPVVVAGASSYISGASAATTQSSHECEVSRNYANNTSWSTGRCASLAFPSVRSTEAINFQRDCTIDGKTYLFPYVYLSNSEGIRGRLARFFNAGMTHPTAYADIGDPVGSKVTYDGVTYKLLAVNKSDSSLFSWGPLGAASNSAAQAAFISPVIAVPFSE